MQQTNHFQGIINSVWSALLVQRDTFSFEFLAHVAVRELFDRVRNEPRSIHWYVSYIFQLYWVARHTTLNHLLVRKNRILLEKLPKRSGLKKVLGVGDGKQWSFMRPKQVSWRHFDFFFAWKRCGGRLNPKNVLGSTEKAWSTRGQIPHCPPHPTPLLASMNSHLSVNVRFYAFRLMRTQNWMFCSWGGKVAQAPKRLHLTALSTHIGFSVSGLARTSLTPPLGTAFRETRCQKANFGFFRIFLTWFSKK